MRVFPGKLDLDILYAGGAADSSTDPADQFWIKSESKQSWSSQLRLSTLNLYISLAISVTHSKFDLSGGIPFCRIHKLVF